MANEFPKAALSALVVTATGLHPSRVLWDGDANPHAGPIGGAITGILTLNLTSDTEQGSLDEDVRDYITSPAPALKTYRVARTRVLVTAKLTEFGSTEAFDVCAQLRRRIGYPLARAGLRQLGLALAGAPQVTNLGETIDRKVHAQAVVELRFNRMIFEDITGQFGNVSGTDGFVETVDPIVRTGNVP